MKQCYITYDKSANTFDIFAGAKGKGRPLKSVCLDETDRNQETLNFLQVLINEAIEQGYKVNLDTEVIELQYNKSPQKIASILKSKEDLMDNFLIEKPKPKFRQWRFEPKEIEVKTELPIYLL